MPVDICVGGQKGDEGKGKICEYLNSNIGYDIILRVSKPQAGHSIIHNGQRIGLATIPCGFTNPKSRILIGTGAYISIEKLLKEIKTTSLPQQRVGIDYNAAIISEEHVKEEKANLNLMKEVGSVGTGSGPATRDKIMRSPHLKFAKDFKELSPYLTDTKEEINLCLEKNGQILIEGDQGYLLSLTHGNFPHVTSDDTTASAFLSKAGIGPREARNVYIIFKPYTSRVGAGSLENEILNPEILKWFHNEGCEKGTVSGRLRRIGEFEWDNALKAIRANSANKLCFTHFDYFQKNEKKEEFLSKLESSILNVYPFPKLSIISFGPNPEDTMSYEKE